MKCTPVIIITLNRYKHLRRCIESLKKNSLAKETDLYIGLDYPPDSRYVEGYKKVQDYLNKGIDGFHKVMIIQQTENKGMFGNFVSVQEEVYKKYDRFIYTEDDNEFAANYLEYMNRCLEKYEHEDSVLAVSGYSYPINKTEFRGNVFRCGTYFSASGYGMWKFKEERMRKHLNKSFFSKLYFDKRFMKKLLNLSRNQYVNMIKGMLEYTPDLIANGEIREVDLAFGLYMVACGKKVVYPVVSKVRNWGYDGSGVNCGRTKIRKSEKMNHRNYQFEEQAIDEDVSFTEIVEDADITQEHINKMLEGYFWVSEREYVKATMAYVLSRGVGIENVRKMIGRK